MGESLDDTLTGEDGAIDNVGPLRYPESSTMVLLLDGVTDIDELAVLEDEEVVLLRERRQAGDGLFAEVG